MGDVITKVDDTEIASMDDMTMVKKQYSAGDTATLTVVRQGEVKTLELTWGTMPEDLTAEEQPQEQQPQNNAQTVDPYDLFDYFFG